MTRLAGHTVAHATVAYLQSAGVRRIYGVPGDDHLHLLHVIEEQGVQYVAARDEGAAGVMATAEAQVTGIPGVLLVTPAPGITNAINGIASAFLDRVPLIVLVGQHAPDRRPVIVRQNLDNHALIAPVSKWSVIMSSRANQIIAKALDLALAAPAGPVLIELRDDVSRSPVIDDAADWLLCGPTAAVVVASGSAVPLRDALTEARRPVLVVGSRAREAPVGQAVARAAAVLHAPIFTTPSAKGSVPSDSVWLAGTFINGNLEDPIIGTADVLVGVGLDAGDVLNGEWRHKVPIIAIDPTGIPPQHFFPMSRTLVGEPASLLDEGVAEIRRHSSTWTTDDVLEYRAGIAEQFDSTGGPLTIPSAIHDARSVLPRDTVVTVDAGFGKPLMSLLWEAHVPNAFISSHGLSTMGYAIPAANAIKLIDSSRPVVAFLGDGSLLMRASELGVAAQLGITPIYVVWLDGSLSQIEVKQRRQGFRAVGVNFPLPNCPAIAAAFGATGVEVSSRNEFRSALTTALDASAPTLIGVRLDHARHAGWFELLRG